MVWYYSIVKLILVPAVFVGIIFAVSPFLPMAPEASKGILIMLATPPATVAVAYAIKYDKEAALASNASLLGTVLAVFAIVFWIVAGSVIFPGVG